MFVLFRRIQSRTLQFVRVFEVALHTGMKRSVYGTALLLKGTVFFGSKLFRNFEKGLNAFFAVNCNGGRFFCGGWVDAHLLFNIVGQ